MKCKNLQKLILSKYGNGDETTKVSWDLNDAISLSTVGRCCRRICEVSTINLVNPHGCLRTIRTKLAIQKTIKSTKGTVLLKASS